MSKINQKTETEVVAMLARGDTQEDIRRELATRGIEVSHTAISKVKQRNTEALQYLQDQVVEYERSQSAEILRDTHQLLSKQVKQANQDFDRKAELDERLDAGEISEEEYWQERRRLTELDMNSLSRLSREMFQQSQIEQGQPTEISNDPKRVHAYLRKIVDNVDEKNHEELVAIMYSDDKQPEYIEGEEVP